MMGSSEIRRVFLSFFEKKNHKILPSASLVPINDPTLLLTNAGMVPFKPYFRGEAPPPHSRISTCQKCVRVVDIDKVGKTVRHLTFFEMLGNFSFGDYFKEGAISYAWEFLTEVVQLPPDKLWISVYEEDEEAANIWENKIKIPSCKIVRMGIEDNFWSSGEVGPCGPCSEIYIDLGESFGCGKKSCSPGCDCDRYIEVWNLVFMEYNRTEDGRLESLPKKNIDTGMGLERLSMILQKTPSPYDIDLFKPLIDYLKELADISKNGKTDQNESLQKDLNFRIIADHSRAATFLIADGVTPSNEGRGYVLRRLIRRAVQLGKSINLPIPFLFKLTPLISRLMSDTYPEIKEKESYIFKMIKNEEERFKETLEQGMNILAGILQKMKTKKEKKIPGEEIFRLYDTYGFPIELTAEIAKNSGLELEYEKYDLIMAEQRERARSAQAKVKDEAKVEFYLQLQERLGKNAQPTNFVGYEKLEAKSSVLALLKHNSFIEELNVGAQIGSPEPVEIVLDTTPFYAEKGGQIGDTGWLENDSVQVEILNTQILPSEIIIHQAKLLKGVLKVGNEVSAKVNKKRRQQIAVHHTATHLLQAALRKVLGEEVRQSGSQITDSHLRFDFSYFRALKERELQEVEMLVNQNIKENREVITLEMSLEEAKNQGALAFFGEKYGEIVRVVKIDDISLELCGGTHLKSTGEIGIFLITKEESIGAGLRRIEALAGEAAYNYVKERIGILREITNILRVPEQEVHLRIQKLKTDLKEKEDYISNLKRELWKKELNNILGEAEEIQGIKIITKRIDNLDFEELRNLGDILKQKIKKGIIILISQNEGKVNIIGMTTKDGKDIGVHIGNIVKEIAKVVGGSGGGKDVAQGGGKDASKIPQALDLAQRLIKRSLK